MDGFVNKVGERFITNEGYEIVIVEYNNAHDLLIEFQDNYKTVVKTNYSNCVRGVISNPYHPSVLGKGYIGVGKYKTKENGKMSKCYMSWFNLLHRALGEEIKQKYQTYKDVIVNEELYNFQKFGEWFDNNYYEVDGERMDLDKDILYKGNKEYSFDAMIFVPHRINSLFTKANNLRGDTPIGVYYRKDTGKYVAKCQTMDTRKYLGQYDTPDEAFYAYKEFKEQYIKEVADAYKDLIPKRLYDAMYRWEVEITD